MPAKCAHCKNLPTKIQPLGIYLTEAYAMALPRINQLLICFEL